MTSEHPEHLEQRSVDAASTRPPDPIVTVLRAQDVYGWPPLDPSKYREERAYELPLSRALTRSYTTDAHFVQYTSPRRLRLNKGAVSETEVCLGVIAFDVDCEPVHGTSEPAPDAWRCTEEAKLAALWEAHPGCFVYWTRGGYRIVYRLTSKVYIRTAEDAAQWRKEYFVACAHLERCFGIVADRACHQWTRLFRLPHATRDGSTAPEDRPTFGEPHDVGVLRIEATPDDVAAAESACSKAFGPVRKLDFTPCGADGFGLLYHLLRARGSLIRQRSANAFDIRCPREHLHTCGATGNGSTWLYLPAAGHEVGAIHCLHGHCSNLDVRGWLQEFSREELDRARRDAGLAMRGAA